MISLLQILVIVLAIDGVLFVTWLLRREKAG